MQYIIPSPSDLFGAGRRLQLLPAQIARPACSVPAPRLLGQNGKRRKLPAWNFSPLSVQRNRRPLFDNDLRLHLLRFDGFLFFGMSMVSTPFCTFASILSFSTFSGRIITLGNDLSRKFATQVHLALLVLVLVFFFLHSKRPTGYRRRFSPEKIILGHSGAASSTL